MKLNIIIHIYFLYTFINLNLALSLSGQKEYNPQAYADALTQQQKQFETKITQVKSQISSVRAVLDNTTITNQIRLVKTEQGLADERNTLYELQQILKLPYQLKECKCAKLDETARAKLSAKITNISETIADLRSALKKCDEERCPRYQQLALELSQSSNYLNIMNETINAECCRQRFIFTPQKPNGLVNLQGSLYKDNLNDKNWYYGNITQKQYALSRFQLSTKFNLTSCPLDAPYADLLENQCFKCPPGQLFNLGERKCIGCQGFNTYLNTKTGKCQNCSTKTFYNYEKKTCDSCPAGQVYDNATRKCKTCSKLQYPNYENYTCSSCPDESFYNETLQKCQICLVEGGQYLNKTTSRCERCPLGTHYSATKKGCVYCEKNYYYNYQTGKCIPCPQGSFYIKKQNVCKKCAEGDYYDKVTQECLRCPNGSVFDQKTQKCISTIPVTPKCPQLYPFYDENTKLCNRCNLTSYFDTATQSCKLNNFTSMCPPDKPLYNVSTLSCTPCPQNTSYDKSMNACRVIVCQQGYILDQNTKQCVPLQPVNKPVEPVKPVQPAKPTQNISTPTNASNPSNPSNGTNATNGETKPNCASDQKYDVTAKKCVDLSSLCNSAIQAYSTTEKKCVPIQKACGDGYYYVTDKKECVSIANLCKADQYFSYKSGQCLQISSTCSLDEYFNQKSDTCEPRSSTCKSSQYYNKTFHQCRLNSELCSQDSFYSNEQSRCISIESTCTANQYYNKSSLKCSQKSLTCTIDQVYNDTQHVCVNKSSMCNNDQFYSSETHACVQGSSICHINEFYNKPTNSCLPIAKLCSLNGSYYSIQTNGCIAKCPIGYQLNTSSNTCVATTSTSSNTSTTTTTTTNTSTKVCKPEQTYLKDVNLCVKTFTTCNQSQYYNSVSYKCQSPTYITSPYNANLLMQSKPFTEYQNYYKQKVNQSASNPDALRDCPPASPYYDSQANACILCKGDSNLFNLQTSKCSRCGSDYVYSPSQYKCLIKTA